MTYTAARHQGAAKIIWLHFWERLLYVVHLYVQSDVTGSTSQCFFFFFLLLYIVIADHFVLKLFFQYKWHRLPVKLWVLSFLCKVEHEIPNEP